MTNYFGIASAQRNATALKDLPDADAVRSKILRNFEYAVVEKGTARDRLMTMVVVGGGPTGVELAGALAELKQHVLRRDYPDLNMAQARVILLEAADRLLPAMPWKLQQKALEQLRAPGVEVIASVRRYTATAPAGRRRRYTWRADRYGIGRRSCSERPYMRHGHAAATEPAARLRHQRYRLPRRSGWPSVSDARAGRAAAGRPRCGQHRPVDARSATAPLPLSGPSHPHDNRPPYGGGARVRAAVQWRLRLGVVAAVHLLAIIGLRNRALVLINWTWNTSAMTAPAVSS